METKTWKMVALALMPVALMAFTSCATTMSGEGEVAVMETKDGALPRLGHGPGVVESVPGARCS